MNFTKKNIIKHTPWLLSDRKFLKEIYPLRMGTPLNLDNPVTFNEKIQWLKLNERRDEYHRMVEKGMAKEFAASVIGEEYIIPTIGIYKRVKDIPWDTLPGQFVLKCTHNSGGLVICRDKATLDIEGAKEKLAKGLKQDFWFNTREWVYKGIPHRIICEKLMGEGSLVDYKYFCFNGVARFMYISSGLEDHSTARISFTDTEGKPMPFRRKDYRTFEPDLIPVPENPGKMKEIAEKLAKASKASFVRVDLYEIDGHIYFSEMTFYPNSGFIPFEPAEWDTKLGEYLTLVR